MVVYSQSSIAPSSQGPLPRYALPPSALHTPHLALAVSQKPLSFYENYMKTDPLFGGEDKKEYILQPPPVDRLFAIYGTSSLSILLQIIITVTIITTTKA